ncbi:MAG: adenine nucleotide alpha hydrolase [Pseudomonadota bacterium]
MSDALDRLIAVLEKIGDVGIALSGGVDSMTLAHVAHARSTSTAEMFHAVSPAVPEHATARVRDHAERHGWVLHVVGAGEFEDPDYLKNPVNRCYFCKTNLYGRLRAATDAVICSGTNTDDLGDFRPGLAAADEKSVRHPFVEAGIDKAGIRAIADGFGLDDIAELPAQPCLASRVETGLPILADQLTLIDRIERQVADQIGPGDIRARMTRDGIRLEVPQAQLGAASSLKATLTRLITEEGHRFAGISAYRRGSAFLRDTA